MRFAPTDEQEQLQEAARGWLSEAPNPSWNRLIAEQGWPAIAIDEDCGGFGFGFVELALVSEEIGRVLAPIPLLASAGLAAGAIQTGGSVTQKKSLLGAISQGTRAALAYEGPLTATRCDNGWHLNGTALRVIDGANAKFLIIATDQGLFHVTDFQASPTASIDPTRELATCTLDCTVPEDARLPQGDLEKALMRGWVLQAAEAVGAAEACLDMAVAYAKVRTQFGKPIGSFQAIKHKCSDLFLLVESARSATWYAAWALDAEAEDAVLAARTAVSYANDALFKCAADSIQIHGGIGFTWEHRCHEYFRRARADQQLLGHPRAHRAAIAHHLLGAI